MSATYFEHVAPSVNNRYPRNSDALFPKKRSRLLAVYVSFATNDHHSDDALFLQPPYSRRRKYASNGTSVHIWESFQ